MSGLTDAEKVDLLQSEDKVVWVKKTSLAMYLLGLLGCDSSFGAWLFSFLETVVVVVVVVRTLTTPTLNGLLNSMC